MIDLSFDFAQTCDFSMVDWIDVCPYLDKGKLQAIPYRLSEYSRNSPKDRSVDWRKQLRRLPQIQKWKALILLHWNELPFVENPKRKDLPEVPALYFVLTKDKLFYVGKTKNLKQRWTGHNSLHLFKKIDGITLKWAEIGFNYDNEYFFLLESDLIRTFEPELNGKKINSSVFWQQGEEVGLSPIGKLAKSYGMTRYQFWKATGLSCPTAYRLYEDSKYNPCERIKESVRRVLNLQPGEWLTYILGGEEE